GRRRRRDRGALGEPLLCQHAPVVGEREPARDQKLAANRGHLAPAGASRLGLIDHRRAPEAGPRVLENSRDRDVDLGPGGGSLVYWPGRRGGRELRLKERLRELVRQVDDVV